MANSPSHKFGQIIGDLLEGAIAPLLASFARKHSLYLDRKEARPARRGRKVTWKDKYGNTHDLDFVLERGGTPQMVGHPVAFIESAWRRYTKHSRSKAQEIEGAISPLFDTYHENHPFLGVILAGVFTDGALTQLRSRGFCVLHFSYSVVVRAFAEVGLDANFDESTLDKVFQEKVDQYYKLSKAKITTIKSALLTLNEAGVKEFMSCLRKSVTRHVISVNVLPLFGETTSHKDILSAVNFIAEYKVGPSKNTFVRYEIIIKYNNGDWIKASFAEKEPTIAFLRTHQCGVDP